jgi:hypothetical protein
MLREVKDLSVEGQPHSHVDSQYIKFFDLADLASLALLREPIRQVRQLLWVGHRVNLLDVSVAGF